MKYIVLLLVVAGVACLVGAWVAFQPAPEGTSQKVRVFSGLAGAISVVGAIISFMGAIAVAS